MGSGKWGFVFQSLRSTHLVHHGKDLIHTLLWGVLIGWQFDHGADHLVDGLHDAEHLLSFFAIQKKRDVRKEDQDHF